MPANNKIVAGGPEVTPKEGEAVEQITPGHLVEYGDTAEMYQLHSEDGGVAMPMFARKVAYSGEPATGDSPIDDPYQAGEYFKGALAHRGNRINAILSDAEDVVPGEFVVSAGNGEIRAFDGAGGDTVGAVLGVAREAITASGPSRVLIEVL